MTQVFEIIAPEKNVYRGLSLVRKNATLNSASLAPKHGTINKSGWCFCTPETFAKLQENQEAVSAAMVELFGEAKELKLHQA